MALECRGEPATHRSQRIPSTCIVSVTVGIETIVCYRVALPLTPWTGRPAASHA